jgi:serine phosphatase RsbU (regulator of sigma subunit)
MSALEQSLPAPIPDPFHSDIMELRGAELASVQYGHGVASDFHDFIRVSPNRALFGLLDAAGGLEQIRGILSASQQTFRTVGAELFAKKDINEADAMMELCLQLNLAILKSAEGVRPCPAFAGCYDEALGVVCYFNAGYTPGLLLDHTGVSELPSTSLPLGLFSHVTADASMVALEPGAALLLVSRGIVEGKCQAEEFGLQGVKDVLQQSKTASAKELCISVVDRVRELMRTPTLDGMTALALTRNP